MNVPTNYLPCSAAGRQYRPSKLCNKRIPPCTLTDSSTVDVLARCCGVIRIDCAFHLQPTPTWCFANLSFLRKAPRSKARQWDNIIGGVTMTCDVQMHCNCKKKTTAFSLFRIEAIVSCLTFERAVLSLSSSASKSHERRVYLVLSKKTARTRRALRGGGMTPKYITCKIKFYWKKCAQRGWKSGPSQLSSCVSIATPRLIQCFCVCSSAMGSVTNMTKFVEWPVVLRVPCRADVLYTGHMYAWAVPVSRPVYSSGAPFTSAMAVLIWGNKCIYGMLTKSSRGLDSSKACRPTLHRAPSRKRPRTNAPSVALTSLAVCISRGVNTRKSRAVSSMGT